MKYGIFRAEENYYSFLKTLPEKIMIELGYHIYKKDLEDFELFEGQENSQEIIAKIGPLLKKITFTKNELIF